MSSDKAMREFDRHMKREHGVMIDKMTDGLVKTLREKELEDYADVIVSHVDKILPNVLFALGPPLTVGVLYLIMKAGMLAHPILAFFAVAGMLSTFFFAIKYDYASKTCRYCGIGIAIAEEKNGELKRQNSALLQRVRELEGQLGIPPLKD